MGSQFHFLNIPAPTTCIENLSHIISLADSWINPDFRFDRIVFTNLDVAQEFLRAIEASDWGIPKIICSPQYAYELDEIFRILGSEANKIKLEILCADTSEERTTLGYFLEDKLEEYGLENPPRCSLVHLNYEIDYKTVSKKIQRRTRKPPAPFQRFLKKKAPTRYPQIIGNDYFARPVFQAFVHQMIEQDEQEKQAENEESRRSPLPLPSSPLKYYDLQSPNGGIEFRFEKYVPFAQFKKIINILQSLVELHPTGIEMLRINLLYESWQTDQDFHNAGRDRCYFAWNDFEFAFRESNSTILQNLSNGNVAALYFQLTPQILPDDFRITLLESIFNTHVIMR